MDIKLFAKKVGSFLQTMAAVCTVSGISAVGLYKILSNPMPIKKFIIDNLNVIFFLIFVLALIGYIIVMPYYQKKHQEIPTLLSTMIIVFLTAGTVITAYLAFKPKILSANSYPQTNEFGDDTKPTQDPESNQQTNIDDIEKSILTPEQETVSKWVLICYEEIVPKNKWRNFTDEELYYIRNGILAYSHYIFESNYYEAFDWYNPGGFDWGIVNYYQRANIENIKDIEAERK